MTSKVCLLYKEGHERPAATFKSTLAHRETDLVLAKEFLFDYEAVLGEAEYLAGVAQEHGTDILLTPTVGFLRSDPGRDWKTVAEQAESSGFTTERGPNEAALQAVGCWFGRDGLRYAFPKRISSPSLHRIPGTTIGALICYELGKVPPENIRGIDLLLVPAAEGDDLHVRDRTIAWAGGEPIAEGIPSSSFYVAKLNNQLGRGVTVIRADTDKSSGVLYLPKGRVVLSAEYTADRAHIHLT